MTKRWQSVVVFPLAENARRNFGDLGANHPSRDSVVHVKPSTTRSSVRGASFTVDRSGVRLLGRNVLDRDNAVRRVMNTNVGTGGRVVGHDLKRKFPKF